MKTVPLTADSIPEIETAIRAHRPVTLVVKGKPVAKVEPIVSVTKEEAARILREISESDQGDDWAEYSSWT